MCEMVSCLTLTLLLLGVLASVSTSEKMAVNLASDPPQYGVDCSSPIHWGIDKYQCPYWYEQYNKIFEGCSRLYSKEECDQNERERMAMSLDQARTQHNYTTVGFKKIRTPKEVWEPLIEFYNKYKDRQVKEKWYRGATIVNTWDSPTYMVSFENPDFPGGLDVKQTVWDGVRPIIEEWIGGHKLEPTSLYGIRLYSNRSILSQHVDRLPLIASCIINVDQDLEEPWPLEVYDHGGHAHNITMEPGDLVLYESSTVLHGRPFPMKGNYFANIFVHFKPIVHEELNRLDDLDRHRRGEPLSVTRHHGRLRSSQLAPPSSRTISDEEAFRASASNGDLLEVRRLLAVKPSLLHQQDEHHWQALHEAVRGGHVDVVQFLVEHGADIGHRVLHGGAVLWLAKQYWNENHAVVRYLHSLGATDDRP